MTDAAAPIPAPQIFFRATRSFRSPKIIVIVCISVVVAVFYGWIAFHPKTQAAAKNTNLAMIVAGVAAFFALTGVRKVLAGEKWELVISTDGVSYRDAIWGWNQIKCIGDVRRSFSSNYNFQIHLIEDSIVADSRIVTLLIDQPMPSDAVAKIFYELGAWLKTHHPNVEIRCQAMKMKL